MSLFSVRCYLCYTLLSILKTPPAETESVRVVRLPWYVCRTPKQEGRLQEQHSWGWAFLVSLSYNSILLQRRTTDRPTLVIQTWELGSHFVENEVNPVTLRKTDGICWLWQNLSLYTTMRFLENASLCCKGSFAILKDLSEKIGGDGNEYGFLLSRKWNGSVFRRYYKIKNG